MIKREKKQIVFNFRQPFTTIYSLVKQSKIQQTKMLVTCQRFCDLFLFALVWQYSKVNSVQEACAKWVVVHILKFEILFFHVVCKISNFEMCTAKHLAQASCMELTLQTRINMIKVASK